MSSLNKRQLIPMLIAVSCLSPVKTQILIPASCNVWIVSGTPSCNLSSIAVAQLTLDFSRLDLRFRLASRLCYLMLWRSL